MLNQLWVTCFTEVLVSVLAAFSSFNGENFLLDDISSEFVVYGLLQAHYTYSNERRKVAWDDFLLWRKSNYSRKNGI